MEKQNFWIFFLLKNVFVLLFYRSLKLKYSNDEKIKGTTTFKFELEKNIFDVPEKNPENFGFSSPPSIGNGVFDLTKCNGGFLPFNFRLILL